ncbi:MAG TPA: COQ9 family protein [Sphingomonas sp.]|uniref:COQ9 family protein n=1 Tax=Sphingomonas sp. TaxID=28214 RepID=UPI002C47A877|nr:COQ9 family protein [Sphingomonas sp.]HMI18026.1 COQ9 family protein [Sphingomonas sp.]
MTEPLDMTLDELRAALVERLPQEAVFEGWNDKALAAAAETIGVPADRARLAFAGGAGQMVDAWFAAIDLQMAEALPPETLAEMRVRDRITALVLARIAAMAPYREAVRRALAVLAMPHNMAMATALGWRAADRMWRLAGDTSTGFAHYTKRMTLLGVYGATLLSFIDDESEHYADTRAFLDRRIDEVMRFEKFKARIKPDPDRHFSIARFLGRLRYPTR